MTRIKLLLLSSFFFFQGIQSYCVYNKLTDGSSFTATQLDSGAPMGKNFSKHLEKDTAQCCPYTSKDCSANLRNDDVALFAIELFFIDKSFSFKYLKCMTGGGLTIHGTKENHYAECTNAQGVFMAIPFQDYKERISKRKDPYIH